MNKKLKLVFKAIVLLFVLIQFYPMEKPKQKEINTNDFITTNKVPNNIVRILKSSCYDCHSNTNKFPWYAKIAPVKWLVYKDIKKGRDQLNFSEWNTLLDDDKTDALFNIGDVIKEKIMPMPIYLAIHKQARLTKKERTEIVSWFEEYAEKNE